MKNEIKRQAFSKPHIIKQHGSAFYEKQVKAFSVKSTDPFGMASKKRYIF